MNILLSWIVKIILKTSELDHERLFSSFLPFQTPTLQIRIAIYVPASSHEGSLMLMFLTNPASGVTRSWYKVAGAFDTKVTKRKETIWNISHFRENISLRELTIWEALTCSVASGSEKKIAYTGWIFSPHVINTNEVCQWAVSLD